MAFELVSGSRPAGYLIIYDEFRDLMNDALRIHGRCYKLSVAGIDTRAKRVDLDRTITYHALRDARFPVKNEVEAEMAHALVRDSAGHVHQQCVLVDEREYKNALRERLAFKTEAAETKYSSRWRALAMRLANKEKSKLP